MKNISKNSEMKLGYSLGSLLTVDQIIDCSKLLSAVKPYSIWIPETWGMEAYSMISTVSKIIPDSKIGSSILNIYSRSPTLIAMGAVTIDLISNERFILGLGTSSEPIVEDFHGVPFQKPIQRMRESVEIIRLALSGNKINYKGNLFKLKNFTMLIKPRRKNIPIYLAAVNENMTNLTWEIADGVIFYLRPLAELKTTISKMQKRKKIEVACQIITCVSTDSEQAIQRAKKTLAFYISVGTIYRKFLERNGYSKETKNIHDEFKKSGFTDNHELVPKQMLDALTICGTPDDCLKKLQNFRNTGITLPILQFNPLGDVKDSFKLLTSTFGGESI